MDWAVLNANGGFILPPKLQPGIQWKNEKDIQ
jgi:hypothetical protein